MSFAMGKLSVLHAYNLPITISAKKRYRIRILVLHFISILVKSQFWSWRDIDVPFEFRPLYRSEMRSMSEMSVSDALFMKTLCYFFVPPTAFNLCHGYNKPGAYHLIVSLL